MNNLLIVFLTLVILKFLINLSNFIQCKREYQRYKKHLTDPSWEFSEYTPKIAELFKDANVNDSKVPFVESVGYGQLYSTHISVIENIANTREDVVAMVTAKFHQAIGIYRSRMWDAVNPLYWAKFILMLPKELLSFLGIQPESLVIKVVQLIYWFASVVFGLLANVYKSEIDVAIKQFISQWIK